MDFGIIGLGNHAINRVMPAIVKSGNRITSIFSRNGEKAARQAGKYGSRPFTSMEEFLSSGCESVYIASPNFLHYSQASQCLKAGKDVLLEKTMTLSNEDAKSLVRESEASGRKLAVGFHMRFHPGILLVRRMILDGEVGNIRRITGTWAGYSSRSRDSPDNIWWSTPEQAGGGSVMGTGVHVLDTIMHVTGARPKAVFARRYPRGEAIDDTEEILLSFEGYSAHVTSSRKIAVPDNSLYIHGDCGTVEAISIFGTEITGSVVHDGNTVKSYDGGNLYEREIDSFVDLVRGNESSIALAADGEAVVRIVNAAVISDREGREIRI